MSASHRELRAHRTPAAVAPAGSTSATIGRRVARILALPAVVVLVLLGVVAGEQIQGFRASRDTARSVQLTLAVQGLIHELQTERGVTAAVLGGNPSFRNELLTARTQVDTQRSTVSGLVQGGGQLETALRNALQQLDGLPAVRSATDSATAGRAAMFTYFTQRIAGLAGIPLGLDRATDDQLRAGAATLQAEEDLAEAIAQERAFLNGVFSAGGFGKGEFVQFAAMRTAKDAAMTRFQQVATAQDKASAGYVFDTGAARASAYFEQVALDAADGRHVIVNPQSWWSGLTTVLDDLRRLQQHTGSQMQLRAHDLQNQAALRIAGLVAAVLLCFGGSIVLAVLASLSITRPLAALAEEADAVASQRLPAAMRRVQEDPEGERPEPPEPVQVPARATREITSVTSALNRLQTSAYGLATDQATQRQRTIASLANLGRRNQNLIRRQLGFITGLEREEMDPTALGNLFELDHLATRMRRNAASLLVLVGESGPRQWTTPIPVTDVVRAAVSEVEEYRRVALRRVDDALVAGQAVGSVVHLLSELIENGLTFSPPDTEVEIQGRMVGEGYLLAITDQGVGMSPEDLHEANARVRGEEDFIAAPTRFLGHFVVGHLARESGIDVELVPSPVIGVTARVTLPGSLLYTQPAIATSAPAPDVDRGADRDGEATVTVLSTTTQSVPAALAPADDAEWDEHETGSVARAGDAVLTGTGAQPGTGVEIGPAAVEPLPDESSAREPSRSGAQVAAADRWGTTASSVVAGGDHRVEDDEDEVELVDVSVHEVPVHEVPVHDVLVHELPVHDRPDGDVPVREVPAHALPPAHDVPAAAAVSEQLRVYDVPSYEAPRTPASWSGRPGESAWDRWSLDPTDQRVPGSMGSDYPVIGRTPTNPGRFGSPASAGDAEADGERTRNGLRKRVPRAQRPVAEPPSEPAQARARVLDLDAASSRPDEVGDSPEEVRARLLSLRAGIQRGQGMPVASGAKPPWPSRPDPAAED